MFIGHFALAFAAKRAAPRVSLGTAVFAAIFLDVLWPVFVLAGIETVSIAPRITAFTPLDFTRYPFSHSLVAACAWGIMLGSVYGLLRHDGRGGWCVGLLVVSHWPLDWIVHRPDLPLYPGEAARHGLGLWNSVTGTLVVEGVLFVAGVAVYLHATWARDAIGRWALAALVVVLVGAYLAVAFGPTPPSVEAIAYSGILALAFIALAAWADHHRQAAPAR